MAGTNQEQVRLRFNEASERYDRQRRQLIPRFGDFYGVAGALAETDAERPDVLDLGAGTGLFASFIRQRYPEARLTLVDLSERMLDVARARFEGDPRVRFVVADYTKLEGAASYDLIVSSLSIHHLTDEEKAALYRNVYAMLRPGGIFVNADQVLGPTPALDALYKAAWREAVERSGLSREELDAAYERTKLDKMATLDRQLGWLRDAGFADVDCMYKHYSFVVMYGRKSL